MDVVSVAERRIPTHIQKDDSAKRGVKRNMVMKTKKRQNYHKKTVRKSSRKSNHTMIKTHIVNTFFEMLHTIKLFHWNTKKYPEHKASDELYEKLNEHIDRFVEIFLGKHPERIHHARSRVSKCANTHQLKIKIHKYQDFLLQMNQLLDSKKDSDLLNIRDEIMGDLNQFLYLLTLH